MKMYFQPDPCRRIEVAFVFKFGGLREKDNPRPYISDQSIINFADMATAPAVKFLFG